MRVVLRVRKKGIVILTKDIRRKAGIDEGDELIVEVEEGKLTMKVLRPKVVDVDPNLVEELLR
ncbi:AbrB family transcriptional regulator, partial [archaeon]